jgi:hypothetical protein
MSDTTTQNIVTSNIPPGAEAMWKNNMTQLQTILDPNSKLPVYGGDRLAERNATQGAAHDVIMGMPGGYQSAFNRAGSTTGAISEFGGNVAAGNLYDPTDYENKLFTKEQYDAAMNPYIDNVLDRAQSRATERFDEQQILRDQAAARTGSFGGSRQYVTNGIAQRDLNNQLSDLEATQMSEAFKNAQGFLGQQRQLGEASKQFGVGTQLKGADIMGVGANLDLNRATQQQRADVTTADAMMKIGEDEQQQSQAALNLDYQDFLNDRDAPMQNALTFNQALRAMPTPTSSSGTSSNTRADTNIWNQLGGLGMTAAGLMGGSGGSRAGLV